MTTCVLADVPDTHKKARDRMSWLLQGRAESTVWLASVKGRAALLAAGPDRIFLSSPTGLGFGVERGIRYVDIARLEGTGNTVILEVTDDATFVVELQGHRPAQDFLEAVALAKQEHAAKAPERADAAKARADERKPATSKVLITTMNDVPGYEIVAVHGDVFGLTVRARSIFGNVAANLRGVVGGEVASYTSLLRTSRDEARERLAAEALAKGANAVVAMRFDCNEIADVMSEVAAYGTAVTIEAIVKPL